MTNKTPSSASSRRAIMTSAVGLVAGAAVAHADDAQQMAQAAKARLPVTPISVAKRGVYASVPLRQDAINVTAIQSRVKAVEINDLKKTMAANIKHVTNLIDYSQGTADEWGHTGERIWGAKQDLICMHEFPIQGFRPWNRKELNKIAFDLPGPEVAAIGAKAKQFG